MVPTLQKKLKKILLFTALFVGLAFQGVHGQSELSPGDVAIVIANSDMNEDGDKTFDFVPLVDLEANTEIKFTDAPYIEANSELADSEGTLTFTTTKAITAGTVLTYASSDENGYESSGSFNPSASGDNIIAFQGERSNPTFLFGVGWARGNSWEYNGGTNTSDIPPDLSESANSIVNLGTGDNYQYDETNGLEGTANSLLALVGNGSNWLENDEEAFSPFGSNFSLVDPPTIAFHTSTVDLSEDSGTAELTVELVEANDTALDVDVAFLSSSSTATNNEDFYDDTGSEFSTETISFGDSEGDGTTKTITINLENDSEFEGSEKAVFQLQNISDGTIIDPDVLTLTIEDDDAPDIVINEIHADPDGTSGDADGNDEVNSRDDEFIELVNNQSTDINISGWTISDEDGLRHTFPDGTVVPADGVLVLFADDGVSPVGSFGGAVVQSSNETETLHLNNDGDTVELSNPDGNTVATYNYGSEANEDQSITIDPDNPGSYIKHSEATGADGALFSPGTKVDGSPFGSKHATAFRGTEGWRMISSPVENATFDDFFGDLWMQGLTGSDDENGDVTIFSWNESDRAFEVPGNGNMDDPIVPGKGYIVYVFEDDEFSTPGIQGGFPKVINSDGTENSEVSNIPVTANDEEGNGIDGNEGWNMLGNPFDTDIIASEVITALEGVDQNATVNGNIYVWDHDQGDGNGDWVTLSGDDTIAPFQGFFVRYETEVNGEVTFTKDDLEANKGTEFYKDNREDVITFDLQLHGEQYYDTYSLEFSENGTTELDRYDAYKLFSLNPNAISLFSTLSDNRLQKNALPKDLESNLEIPLSFDANGRSSLTFRWNDSMEELPNEWDLILIDNDQNREIDLRRNKEYSFNVNAEQSEESQSTSGKKGLLNKAEVTQDSRFVLSVQPNVQGEISSDLPESVKLKPNYPNPFNPTTTIPFELNEDADVLLTVWNMIGQKVETLIDGTMEAGTHEATWNASNMPSGMYIARFEVNGTVFTRKMTLIK